MYSDEPYRDFESHEEDIENRKLHRPICEECGEVITDYYAYRIGNVWICSDCMEEHRLEIEPW